MIANCLQGKNISFKRHQQMILSDISISLTSGKLVALIGPNGAGKSSLLKILTGYYTPTSGECLLKNKPLSQWSGNILAKERAVMKQLNSVSFSISAKEVIELGRAPWSEPLNKDIIAKIINLTECETLLYKNYMQLSGGEQQRIQLARVLAQLWWPQGPSGWLFLDEPTSALDLYHQQHILRMLKKLTGQFALSVCMVVHDLNLATLWADEIFLLNQGKMVAQGTPTEVITEEILTNWYCADLQVITTAPSNIPYVILSP